VDNDQPKDRSLQREIPQPSMGFNEKSGYTRLRQE
jgi:hypothetical protein